MEDRAFSSGQELNCPRCNALLDPKKISCAKCGCIYRNPTPKRLLVRERAVERLRSSGASSHTLEKAEQELDRERFLHGR